jgi:hypothetical protein
MGRFCRWCIEGKKENGFTTEAAEESRGHGELDDEVGIEEVPHCADSVRNDGVLLGEVVG